MFKNHFYCLIALDTSDSGFSRHPSLRTKLLMTAALNWKSNCNFDFDESKHFLPLPWSWIFVLLTSGTVG